jgi:hypothetical protein
MKKSVYDIGDWVFVKYNKEPPPEVGVIVDVDVEIDGIKPVLYRILLQTYHIPLWVHEKHVKSAIG